MLQSEELKIFELLKLSSRFENSAIRRQLTFEPGSDLAELFDAIKAGKVPSRLREKKRYAPNRTEIKQRCLDALLLIDPYSTSKRASETSPTSEVFNAKLESWKKTSIAKLCELLTLDEVGQQTALRGYRISSAFGLTQPSFVFADILRRDAAYTGSEKDFERWAEESRRLGELNSLETELSILYERIQLHASLTCENKKLRDLADKCYEESKVYLTEGASFTVQYFCHTIAALAHQANRRFQETIASCQNHIKLLQANPEVCSAMQIVLVHTKIAACELQLGNLDHASETLALAKALLNEAPAAAIAISELESLILVRQGRAIEALKLLRDIPSDELAMLPAWRRERLALIEGYYLYALGELSSIETKLYLSHYSKDKDGFNVAAIILPLLVAIENGSYDEASNRIEALRKYRQRNLNALKHSRTDYFIQSLLSMPRSDRTSLVATLSKLSGEIPSPTLTSDTLDGFEIIPYELITTRLITASA